MTNQIRKQVEHYLSESFDFDKDINRLHNVSLTEGQISTILYIMEGYLQGSDDNEDTQFTNDCDDIFAKLEGVVDTYYNNKGDISTVKDSHYIKCESNNKNNATYNEVDYVEQCITEGNDYADCVDTLVDKMGSSNV